MARVVRRAEGSRVPLRLLGPRPDGDCLQLTVSCTTSRDDSAPPVRHPLSIAPDWSIVVPHDLDAERVAVAFGGYVSCLDLVDKAVPTAREWLRRAVRGELPPVTYAGDVDRWRVREMAACCPPKGFDDAIKAAEHWRSARHVALVMGARPPQVHALTAALRRAHAGTSTLAMPEPDRRRAAEVCVNGENDVAWLWEAGIHPRLIWQVHADIDGVGRLPARFFLGVLWNRPDLRWLRDTLDGRDDPAEVYESEQAIDAPDQHVEPLATWLAWSAANWDVVSPTARARWLDIGMSRSLILLLGNAGYDPDEVVAHAQAVSRTTDGVARTLAGWVRNGFSPAPTSLTALARAGIAPGKVPSRAAVDRLRRRVGGRRTVWSDTDLALLLVEHGTVANAAAALDAGAHPC